MSSEIKEVFQEAYDEAIENGFTDDEAMQRGDDAVAEWMADLTDDAMERLKENPELETKIRERVKHLDMTGGVKCTKS